MKNTYPKKKSKIFTGTILYNYEGNKIRVIDKLNNSFKVLDLKTKNKYIISEEDISKYIILNRDGFINIVKIIYYPKDNNYDFNNDILVLFYSRNNLIKLKDIYVPNVVCRLGISNMINGFIMESPDFGMSVSTVNEYSDDYEKSILKINHKFIKKEEIIDIYLMDTLDTITEIIGNKYDNFVRRSIRLNSKSFIYRSLKDLLEKTDFMYEFYNALNIKQINYKLSEGINVRITNPKLKWDIESILEISLDDKEFIIKKYSKDIILENIKMNYFLVLDSNRDLYILSYHDSFIKMKSYKDINSNIQKSLLKNIGM